MEGIRVIGFDADDTLWVNETYFLETEQKLRLLLAPYVDGETVSTELFRTESTNMPLYGYGVKHTFFQCLKQILVFLMGKSLTVYLRKSLFLEKNNYPNP